MWSCLEWARTRGLCLILSPRLILYAGAPSWTEQIWAQPAGGGYDTVYPKYLSLLSSVSLTAIPRYQIYLCSALSMLYACRLTIAAAIVLAHPMFLWVQCICDPLRHGSQHILYAQTRLIPSLGWQDIFILATVMYASTSKSEYFVTLLFANLWHHR